MIIYNYELIASQSEGDSILEFTIKIPAQLLSHSNNQEKVHVVVHEGATMDQLLDALETLCPGIKGRLVDEEGKQRRFVNLYVNRDDIRLGEGLATVLKEGDEITIVPGMAGG